jgi:DNA-directed RNA polymerase subunit RPC12/RpoP
MSERKVLNKYYPPDFDHSKLEKVVRPRDKQDNVRMMLPMSVRCNTCGNFLYIGTKFDMRKETCLDENYLGIKIYRFYFKCSRCHAEISMKTDPKNHDYVCEDGASRNYEPWRDAQHAKMVHQAKAQLEDDQDAMKKIERKGFNSRREMDVIDALNEVRMLNKRMGNVDHDTLLTTTLDRHEKD